MPSRLHERPKPTIRDFIADNARVVAVEGFTPWAGATIERGRYYTLDAPIVRQNPQFFAVVIPLADLLAGEIERGGE
jgi:hypothetical protein